MSKPIESERSFLGINHLSLRGILIGMLGSGIITASSMYVALRISALPWPTIFGAVLSMALLKALGKTTLNEINIAQTGMSAGAMIAGGLAFTLPGLWITGQWEGVSMMADHIWEVMAIAMAGMILGTVLTWFLRLRFIEGEQLPYPIGAAAAETLVAGDSGGKKSAILFITMGLSTVFTFLRDSVGIIPPALVSNWLYTRNYFVGIWFSPMAAGIGFMIGTLYMGVWFLGSLLSYLVIIPIGHTMGLFPSVEAAIVFKNTAGIGLMVGTGAGILISFIGSTLKKYLARRVALTSTQNSSQIGKTASKHFLITLPVAAAFVITVLSGLGIVPSLLLMAGVFAASAMAATITGQTGINPMEIFGIIVLLAIRAIVNVDITGAFLIAACVAVACGYAGDLLNDYKTGHILGTSPVAQLVSQVAGGIVGTVIASAALFAVIGQFGGVGPDTGLPAGQAFAVSQMVNGIGSPTIFSIAVAFGALLYLLKVPSMTLGIGMYLPFEISSIAFLGGLTRFAVDRIRPKSVETGNIAASGFLGGEGITGVTVAIIKMITGG